MPDEEAESPPGALGCPGEAPPSTPRCLAVSPPVWLVQSMAGPVPGARLPRLLDEVLDRPPLPRAAAEREVNARQASVLHLQAAPRASVHDGAILGGCQGERRRDRQTDRQTDRQGDRETAMEKQRQGQRKMDDGERQREGQRDREVERQK